MTLFHRFGALVTCALILLSPMARTAGAAQSDPLAWRNAGNLAELVSHLETWLDTNTDLPRRDSMPTFAQVSLAKANDLQRGAQAVRADTTRGLYDPETQAIYLVRPWDARNPFDVSVLLHELVHHRQNGGGHWYCPGAQELDAYRIQEAWLAELGLEPNVNWIAVILEAGCTPRDIHPD